MEFNKVTRGNKRERNDEESVYQILDSSFLCHVAFQHQGQVMQIPTAYGRKEDTLFIHGSTKNFMMNQLLDGQTCCISVTQLDGIVLAKSLFHTSVNYRSVVAFGKAKLVEEEQEKLEGLKIITENIVKGRWDEVPVGTENELKGTLVIKIKIDSVSAKIRSGGPMGDETMVEKVWSGQIPLVMKALEPIKDVKFIDEVELSESVRHYWQSNK